MNRDMKAVGIYRALPIDSPGSMVDVLLPLPQLGQMDILVKIEAIAVNPADYRSRLRKADDGSLVILGWDVAGTVEIVGAGVPPQFKVGDKVFYAGDNSRQGANSQYHAVDFRIVGHRPLRITAAAAASLPLTTLTAWEALFDRLGFRTDSPNRFRSLLVLGGAGGVGSMTLQLARLIPDLTVIATASRLESKEWCLKLGAHIVIDHSKDLSTQLRNNSIDSVDAVFILNNPDDYFPVIADIITPQGAICCIVPFMQPQNLNLIMRKSIAFHWELMFTRPVFNTDDMSRQSSILNSVSTMVDRGFIVPPLQEELSPFCAETVIEAHRRLETHRTIGKIAITGFD